MNNIGINSVKVNGVRINGIGSPSHSSPAKSSLPPHIKDALVGVWCTEGKTNDDLDRDIIKNKISGRGGDFKILNAAYKDNSGYGGGDGIRSNITITDSGKSSFKDVQYRGYTIVKGKQIHQGSNYIHSNIYDNTFNFNIKISGLSTTDALYIQQYSRPDVLKIKLHNGLNRVYVPIADLSYPYAALYTDMVLSNDVTVEFLHFYPGAIVTDGVDDIIISQKSVSEMLEDSDEITVVSMIHQISGTPAYTNYIPSPNNVSILRTNVNAIDKTGIYGYSCKNINYPIDTNTSIISPVLGDKADYTTYAGAGSGTGSDRVFIVGTMKNGSIILNSSIAYYWTMMFKSASITIDDIHQVIAHYNLDKRVVPTIYYDIKKQGLSNDTPDKDWYLKDFSGNGRDAKLYNFAKNLNSGVGLYTVDFNDWQHYGNVTSSSKLAVRANYPGAWVAYKDNYYHDTYKVEINGLDDGKKVPYRYYDEGGVMSSVNLYNGENIIPKSFGSNRIGFGAISGNSKEVTIEQIPEHDGALVFDGVDDYAQYLGDLGLKDYTLAIDRAYVEVGDRIGLAISDSNNNYANSPFLFEYCLGAKNIAAFSYSSSSNDVTEKFVPTRNISWQSKYLYNGKLLKIVGASNDLKGGVGLTISKYSTFYAKSALRSLLLFPYSLSEFLLDRQLKRYKLGTLYPETKK